MTMGVYVIRNRITGRVYVGSSFNVERRWQVHRAELRSRRAFNQSFKNDWHAYGERAFDFAIVYETTDKRVLHVVERRILDEARSDPGVYNIGRDIKPLKGVAALLRQAEQARPTPPESPS